MSLVIPYEYWRNETSCRWLLAAKEFEVVLGKQFEWFYHFPFFVLEGVYAQYEIDAWNRVRPPAIPRSAFVASRDADASVKATVRHHMSELSRVAMLGDAIGEADQESYREAMLAILRLLPVAPTDPNSTLFVGPQREGRWLGDKLGWFNGPNCLLPHAKRIPYDKGLIVGIRDCQPPEGLQFANVVIIDGAIASGATIVSIMHRLRNVTTSFKIYAGHATYVGLRAIDRYAKSFNFKVSITVGHATDGMNNNYYAVDSLGNPIIGDVGDIMLGKFLP